MMKNFDLKSFGTLKAGGFALLNAGAWNINSAIAIGLSATITIAFGVNALRDSWDEVQKIKLRQEINGVAFNNTTIFPNHEKLNDDSNNNITVGTLQKKLLIMQSKVNNTLQHLTNNSSLV